MGQTTLKGLGSAGLRSGRAQNNSPTHPPPAASAHGGDWAPPRQDRSTPTPSHQGLPRPQPQIAFRLLTMPGTCSRAKSRRGQVSGTPHWATCFGTPLHAQVSPEQPCLHRGWGRGAPVAQRFSCTFGVQEGKEGWRRGAGSEGGWWGTRFPVLSMGP